MTSSGYTVTTLENDVDVSITMRLKISGLQNIFAASDILTLQGSAALGDDLKYILNYQPRAEMTVLWIAPSRQVGLGSKVTNGSRAHAISSYDIRVSALSLSGTEFSTSKTRLLMSNLVFTVHMALERALFDREDLKQVKEDDAFVLQVEVQSCRSRQIRSPAIRRVLHRALRKISTGDITFVTFGGRHPSGALGTGQDLVADVSVLGEECPKLVDVITKLESMQDDVLQSEDSMHVAGGGRETDYVDPDSDYEDVDDLADDLATSLELEEVSMMDEDEDRSASESAGASDADEESGVKTSQADIIASSNSEKAEKKALPLRVVVSGAAAVSWEALLYYLYTGVIEFAPLRSSGVDSRKAAVQAYAAKETNRPALASPKSMFRLARKFELDDLKQLCLDAIDKRLTVENVLFELFSIFTSKHDEVKELELKFLATHWKVIKNSTRFTDLMIDVAKGVYPHAGGILAEIMGCVKSASEDDQSVAGSTTSTTTAPTTTKASTAVAKTLTAST